MLKIVRNSTVSWKKQEVIMRKMFKTEIRNYGNDKV